METALPIVVADHHIRLAPRHTIVIARKDAAQGRRDAQNVERFAGDELANRFLGGRISVGNIDVVLASEAEKSEARGVSGGGAELLIFGIAEGFAEAGGFFTRVQDLG